MASRMKERYDKEIRPELIKRFEYSSSMQAPKLEKIVVNMGVGDAKQDSKVLEAAQEQLATITGQAPNIRRSKKSIAQFKLREGMAVGLAVTLRGDKMYEFLDRLMSVAIPRIRDFRGLNPKSFDGRGNYAIGVREQIIFPEIDYDAVDQVRGLDIVMATSAQTDEEAFALLQLFGMPFAKPAEPKPEPVAQAPAAEEPAAEAEEAPAEESTEEPEAAEVEAEEAPEAEAEAPADEETSDEGEGEAEEAPAEDAE